MCGIAGIWQYGSEESVRTMMRRLRHRGPDAAGLYRRAGRVIGHRRLSIMDPEGGDQPIYSADGARAVCANGEIYNHPALRERLGARHAYRTSCDSESALHLYEEAFVGAAEQLDGMFALALADGPDLYVARDPIGIKPLYVGRHVNGLVFASELKALAGLAQEVREFPPGTWYHSRLGFKQFYEVPDARPVARSMDDQARRLREALDRAVTKRLMSDVPLGAFLSGGLDSSLIAAIAKRRLGRLDTFTVGVEGSGDLQAARRVAEYLGTNHHEYLLRPEEIREKLPEIIYFLESYDQDLVRSGIPCYFTARLAADHVKVILTGEGADELFAGYAYYKGVPDPARLGRELKRSVSSLHNINLQRVDRLTMAHSIEARVPFLDTELIELAQQIPPQMKLRTGSEGRRVEKWILRKACEDLLPEDVLWREKKQFDEGSGTVDLLDESLRGILPPEQAALYETEHPDARLRSAEECAYHRIAREVFEDAELVLKNVARWSDRPVAV